ncbi:hypothetical protein AciX9_2744 [Granulicella tundricola MP5ACTX9]|uniref:Uncharacterized protein n=1 Tax=Granulicella tundricola (strain ATCC BAA-1859 / DSM 23138 / MP5ACTX9) TaxID=1198114 RepID=E8WXS3_GRATM|nr:hypothetical protein AciX9_2744 [Granulicella tundricola MP5ACTX9]
MPDIAIAASFILIILIPCLVAMTSVEKSEPAPTRNR